MNLYVIVYKLTGDEKIYLILDASAQEQQETTRRILEATQETLDAMHVGSMPIQINGSYYGSSKDASTFVPAFV